VEKLKGQLLLLYSITHLLVISATSRRCPSQSQPPQQHAVCAPTDTTTSRVRRTVVCGIRFAQWHRTCSYRYSIRSVIVDRLIDIDKTMAITSVTLSALDVCYLLLEHCSGASAFARLWARTEKFGWASPRCFANLGGLSPP